MLLLLHKTLKGSRNIQGFALIRVVLFTFSLSLFMRVEFTESWRCDSEIEIIEHTKPTTGTHQLQPNYASSLKIHMIECYRRTYGSDLRKTGTYEKWES